MKIVVKRDKVLDLILINLFDPIRIIFHMESLTYRSSYWGSLESPFYLMERVML